MTGRHKLKPGVYVIVPSSYEAGTEGEFLLRIFSEKQQHMECASVHVDAYLLKAHILHFYDSMSTMLYPYLIVRRERDEVSTISDVDVRLFSVLSCLPAPSSAVRVCALCRLQ